MKTKFVIAACAAAMLAPVSVSATVQSEEAAVVVKPSLKTWSDRMFRNLNRKLRYPLGIVAMPVNTGVVAVKFRSNADGTPEAVELVKSSGHRDLDEATLNAVNKISSLRPLPVGMNGEQNFVVRVLFAESFVDLQQKYAELNADAVNRNALVVKSDSSLAAALEIEPV